MPSPTMPSPILSIDTSLLRHRTLDARFEPIQYPHYSIRLARSSRRVARLVHTTRGTGMTAQWFVEVGETAEFTKTVTETDVAMFCAISGDFDPIHIDEEYARTTVFGRRIA